MTRIEEKLGYTFKDEKLLQTALTHPSYAHEHHRENDNQRLEFLGDAVLDLIISDALFTDHHLDEGELTKKRASLVCEQSLYTLAEALSLGEDLLLGHTYKDHAIPKSILSDAIEAIIGAMYLDSSYKEVKSIVMNSFWIHLQSSMTTEEILDPKSKLQELIQKNSNSRIEYKTIKTEGPDHLKEFTVGLFIDGVMVGTGKGSSKKRAEKQAAQEYLSNEIH